MDSGIKKKNLKDILTENQLNCIINKKSKNNSELISYELTPATEELTGFLGDHLKATLLVKDGDSVKKMHVFVKAMPILNDQICEFINECNFFGRESMVYEIFEQFSDDEFSDANPWGVKAFIYSRKIMVLPDLSLEGYKTYPATKHLDLDHVLVTLGSLARFHAAFANSETYIGKAAYKDKLSCFLKDPQFCDCSWLRAAIKTTSSILLEFSTKQYPENLEQCLTEWFLETCNRLKDHDDTLNVIIHKDLWTNNIMFKYSGGEPVNAILIDFQCTRYAPPAIDVMVFLYYTTSRKFREHYERQMLDHYFSVFSASIDIPTKLRMDELNYNRNAFFNFCDMFRSVGMIVPVAIGPFVFLSSGDAQESYDDPSTFKKNLLEDRHRLVCKSARANECYKARVLEISEEFIEKYLNK